MAIKTSLSVTPSKYEGPAPASIKFNGVIEAEDLPHGTLIEYRFIRSDSGHGPSKTLTVKKAKEVFHVANTWMLGKSYSGWQSIEIISPLHIVSNQAAFSVKCNRVDITVGSFNVLTEDDNWVKFAPVIFNTGDTVITGPFNILIAAGIESWVHVYEPIEIPASVVIPPKGRYEAEYRCRQELWKKSIYYISIHIDPERKLKEMEQNRMNNSFNGWWKYF